MPTTAVPPSRARRAWSQTWRVAVAVLFGASSGLAIYGTSAALDASVDAPATTAWFVLDVVLFFVCAVVYVRRHRAPFALTGVLVVLGSFSVLSGGFVFLGVVSLATRRRWTEIGAVCALWLGASVVSERVVLTALTPAALGGPPDWVMLLAVLVSTALPVLVGLVIGSRRALVASLREQAAIARREADARGDTARAAERNRIAREMHDVLAHRLSLVALHAGALEYRADLDPAQVREAAAVVRSSAHEALGELREVLGLLRDTDAADEQSRPQPTLAQVGELVEGTRAAGSPVTYVLDRVGEDDLARLPVSTSRHLYRIVQETLTNARKHAPGAPVKVRLHGTPGERVAVEVTNPPPTRPPATPLPTSGWGLTGLAERLRLTGGELDVRRHPDGTFAVEAWLPWAAGTEGQA